MAVDIGAVKTLATLAIIGLAVREDLLRQRIPNALSLTAMVIAVSFAALQQEIGALASALGGAVIGFSILVPFYVLRGMGAGDVKLMSGAGALLGPSGAFSAAMLTLVAGFIFAVGIVVWRLVGHRTGLERSLPTPVSIGSRAAVDFVIARKERFPYAAAIALGVVTTLWLQGALGRLYVSIGLG